jgi:hypothetical protein
VGDRDINGVLTALDKIIDQAWEERRRAGYFAAMYRNVTRRVKAGIAAQRFEDGPRMDRFDAIFADRYLDSYVAFREGRRPTRSWIVAFESERNPAITVLQHLLLGMNAHINLDLGLCAAEVAPGATLPSLRKDFLTINDLLAEEASLVEASLAAISPAGRLLRDARVVSENRFVTFSLDRARDFAWAVAEQFAGHPEQRDVRLAATDLAVAAIATAIKYPPPKMAAALAAVRMSEQQDPRLIIDALCGELHAAAAAIRLQ